MASGGVLRWQDMPFFGYDRALVRSMRRKKCQIACMKAL